MITPLRALVRKDIRLFFADRRAVIMGFIAPIAIASFFGYIFGNNGSGNGEPSPLSVLYVDHDASPISKAILADLQKQKSLAMNVMDEDQARAAVRKGLASVAIVVPKDFGEQAGRAFFRPENKPEITVLYDPSHTAERSMVQGVLTGSVMQVVSREMFGGATGQTMVDESLADLADNRGMSAADKNSLRGLLEGVKQWNESRASGGGSVVQTGITMPYKLNPEAVTAHNGAAYNGYAHSFAGMSVQFILFTGVEVGIGMLLQRQRGLWKRLRAAPLSRGLLLGSRALSAAITSMMILTVVFTFARIVFHVKIEGSFAGFVGICIAFSLMTASFGLLIAGLGKTAEATRGLAIFVTLIMVMLGGAWVPAFLFPQWLQTLTMFIPTRWAMDGLDGMTWRGLGFSAALQPIGLLLLSSGIFTGLAISRFRWESEN
ncbi:MAG: ABC-2 transporter permease [Acidobacteriota bacterium]|nr:ABC-2 transporter permease [Acidobacteriota bacterium]